MNRFQANLCLLTATLCWALEPTLLKRFDLDVSVMGVVAMTSGLAAVCLGIVFWSRWRVRPSRASLSKLGYLAVLDLVASALGFWGARQVDLSTSAFLLALCVVGVPVVLVVKRRPVPGRTWVGIAVILLGLALAVQIRPGSMAWVPTVVLLGAAAVRSVYMVGVNDMSKTHDPAQMAVYLLAGASVLGFVGWTVTDPGSITGMDYSANFWATLVMYALFVFSIFTATSFLAQPYASAQSVAVIYSLEVTFAVLLGAVLPHLLVDRIHLTLAVLAGCLLTCLGVIVAEVDLVASFRASVSRAAR